MSTTLPGSAWSHLARRSRWGCADLLMHRACPPRGSTCCRSLSADRTTHGKQQAARDGTPSRAGPLASPCSRGRASERRLGGAEASDQIPDASDDRLVGVRGGRDSAASFASGAGRRRGARHRSSGERGIHEVGAWSGPPGYLVRCPSGIDDHATEAGTAAIGWVPYSAGRGYLKVSVDGVEDCRGDVRGRLGRPVEEEEHEVVVDVAPRSHTTVWPSKFIT